MLSSASYLVLLVSHLVLLVSGLELLASVAVVMFIELLPSLSCHSSAATKFELPIESKLLLLPCLSCFVFLVLRVGRLSRPAMYKLSSCQATLNRRC